MRPIPPTRLLVKRHIPAAFAALVAVLGVAIHLELLGWRILTPELSLSEAWNRAFVLGALRTATGAALLGILPLLIAGIPRRTRPWSFAHPVLLWSTGAGTFLLAMAALVMWAP